MRITRHSTTVTVTATLGTGTVGPCAAWPVCSFKLAARARSGVRTLAGPLAPTATPLAQAHSGTQALEASAQTGEAQ